MIERGSSDELIFECDACGEPVTGTDGYLHIDDAAVGAAEAAAAEWKKKYPGIVSAKERPRAVPWQVHHHACDPRPDSGDYTIQISRCDTWPKLTHWTGHLMEKSWLEHTTWSGILMSIGEDA